MDNHSELTPALPLDFSNDRLPPSTKEEDNACLAMRRQFREPSPALGTGVKKLPFPWEAGFVPRMHRNTEIQATWREWVDSVDHYQLPRKVEPEHRPAFWAYVEWFNLLEFKWLKHGQLGVNFLVKVNGKKRLAKGRTAYMKAFGKHVSSVHHSKTILYMHSHGRLIATEATLDLGDTAVVPLRVSVPRLCPSPPHRGPDRRQSTLRKAASCLCFARFRRPPDAMTYAPYELSLPLTCICHTFLQCNRMHM